MALFGALAVIYMAALVLLENGDKRRPANILQSFYFAIRSKCKKTFFQPAEKPKGKKISRVEAEYLNAKTIQDYEKLLVRSIIQVKDQLKKEVNGILTFESYAVLFILVSRHARLALNCEKSMNLEEARVELLRADPNDVAIHK